ncbi:MAG TPA: DUF6526 family protein [Pyrinomonadaceae bacterium]|nr:DUF6526 family protein [Pyrinomonadaceae bacterium]
MADNPQTYSNHTRWHPPFHFFVAPVMLINVIWAIVKFVREPGWDQGWWVVVSIALVVLTTLVRINPLRVQDRLIRLEEQLRHQQLLPAELAHEARRLRAGQLVALRFAHDDELEELVRETLAGRLTKPAEIKRAIKQWRADTARV